MPTAGTVVPAAEPRKRASASAKTPPLAPTTHTPSPVGVGVMPTPAVPTSDGAGKLGAPPVPVTAPPGETVQRPPCGRSRATAAPGITCAAPPSRTTFDDD